MCSASTVYVRNADSKITACLAAWNHKPIVCVCGWTISGNSMIVCPVVYTHCLWHMACQAAG